MRSHFLSAFAAAAVLTFSSGAAMASVTTGLTEDTAARIFTTQASTPANQNSAYNQRHRPIFGGQMSGVARLFLDPNPQGFGTLCTSSLMLSRRHVLTAAHCVTDANGVVDINLANTNVAQFPTINTGGFTGQVQNVNISAITVHPLWNGVLRLGNDIAVLTLATDAPASAQAYDLYGGQDEMGQVSTKVGWGTIGQGNSAATIGSGWRMGQNIYESTNAAWRAGFGFSPGSDNVLMYDFDNGLAANDAFGFYFGMNNLGLGDMEVNSAPGDSGGPTFIGNAVAGVTSFGTTLITGTASNGAPLCNFPEARPDVVCGVNSTFGEFSGDTRVSSYNAWIRSIINVPTPATLPMMALALGLLAFSRRARKTA